MELKLGYFKLPNSSPFHVIKGELHWAPSSLTDSLKVFLNPNNWKPLLVGVRGSALITKALRHSSVNKMLSLKFWYDHDCLTIIIKTMKIFNPLFNVKKLMSISITSYKYARPGLLRLPLILIYSFSTFLNP